MWWSHINEPLQAGPRPFLFHLVSELAFRSMQLFQSLLLAVPAVMVTVVAASSLPHPPQTTTFKNDHPLIYYHGRWDASPGTWWYVILLIRILFKHSDSNDSELKGRFRVQNQREESQRLVNQSRRAHYVAICLCWCLRGWFWVLHCQCLGRCKPYPTYTSCNFLFDEAATTVFHISQNQRRRMAK